MKYEIGDKVIFKKGEWDDHRYIDNCSGTIKWLIHGDYVIEWILPTGSLVEDTFQSRHEDFLHIDLRQIRNDKLKELGL